jgi:hypothetical protein
MQIDFITQFDQEADVNRQVILKSEMFPIHSSIHDLKKIVVSGKLITARAKS